MTALLILLPLMAMEAQPDPAPPIPTEQRIARACQSDFTGYEEDPLEGPPLVRVEFLLREELHVEPLRYVFGAISEVDWLTRPKEWMEGLREAIHGLAVNGVVVVYRVRIETVEQEGKRFYQVVILYDV